MARRPGQTPLRGRGHRRTLIDLAARAPAMGFERSVPAMKNIFSKYSPLSFISLFALIAIASYQLWKVEELTVTNIVAAMLMTLLVVGICATALYLLVLLVRRIALTFGVQLGEWGSDRALDAFIAARRRALARLGGRHRSLTRGRTQFLLGQALGERGQRATGADTLRESANAFRDSLAAFHEAGKLDSWAIGQGNLAMSLFHLSRQETGTASLKEAIDALRAASEHWETADNMADWSEVQFRLCAALTRFGRLEDGTARLAEAVAAGRAALAAENNDDVPMAAARLQINLAEALALLGERETGTERLEEAVAMARESLRVIGEDKDDILTRDESIQWRLTQIGNLGHALCCLGERRDDTEMLREAVETLRSTGPLRTDKNLYDWAVVQDELARTLRSLHRRDADPAHLTESLSASDAALTILTRETYPFDWAVATATRANTLTAFAESSPDAAPLRQAVDELKAALAVFERAEAPFHSRQCRDDLDRATALLDELAR